MHGHAWKHTHSRSAPGASHANGITRECRAQARSQQGEWRRVRTGLHAGRDLPADGRGGLGRQRVRPRPREARAQVVVRQHLRARAPGSRRARPVAAVTALSLLSAAVTALSCLLLLSLCCHTQRAQKRAGSTSSRGSVAKWRSNRPCVHTAECSSAGRTTSPAQGPEPAGPDSGPRAKSRHRAPCPSAPLL